MHKALPGPNHDPDAHDYVRHDRIGSTGTVTLRVAGVLRHIGIGRTHKGTHVFLLIQDHQVRVVNATTGELLRELTIDPSRDYQPRAWQKARTHIRGFGPCRCPETSHTERPRHKDLRVFTDI
ncbi:hypothetical protein [Kocuria sp. NPDC057446]|uniref:hypothetical protein n=1 Tax=Kocuria sp. NPDC057446 TaxID=3346137 RepID=UPI0036B0AE47